jgi:hypothetical protein
MKKLLAIAALALLASCGDSNNQPLKQTRDDPKFSVELVIVPEHSIKKTCADLGVQYEANGCTAFHTPANHCVIYVMPQRFMHDEQRLSIIGHELWHCRYGEWHD